MKVDLSKKTDADNLPDNAKDQCGRSLDEIIGANVDNVAANGLGRVDGERVILVDLVDVEALEVESAVVHSVRHGAVDEFVEQHSVVHAGEERVVVD